MIKINLLEQKKPFKLPVVMGIDLGDLSWKGLIFVGMLSYVPELVLYPQWKEDKKEIKAEITKLQIAHRKLKKGLRGNKDIKDRLNAFNKQVSKLQKRTVQVDLILQEKRNPSLIMEKIARKLPSDIWFKSFLIAEDKTMTIKGGGVLYKSIGDFIASANNAGFFGQPLSLKESKTVEEDKGSDYRTQEFTIVGKIDKFDPWSQ
ncbi:hypothetical protein A9Q84_21400 [Halobacteriovorax marinus]|uniref:Uncharacterized protein n=1 Tax=Halobacteriovorax marinus TaxID=97084 RepID=A0A1Y5F5N0_9BACT|nr:hypothetical protein A9Q84_21400 [Halobacteriovorax marinus]